MKKTILLSLALGILASININAATVMGVDWLTLSSGNELQSDDGSGVGTAQVSVTTGNLLPGSPSGDIIAEGFWDEIIPFTDSLSGDRQLTTIQAQVGPSGGSASWEMAFALGDATEVILAVGQMLADGTSGTQSIDLSVSSAGSVTVNYLGAFGWDDGFKSYAKEVSWDSGSQRLSLVDLVSGESKMAFFQLQAASGIDTVTVDLANAYDQNLGDTIEFAVGLPIPEPGTGALMILSGVLLLGRRRGRSI